MGERSAIEWTHHTFNPWWGCAKVSAGCTHCYADTFSTRVGHGARLPAIWGVNAERKMFGAKHWAEPVKWNAKAAALGERHRVFCASMADVFEDRPDLVVPRAQLLSLIMATPSLDWLLLTKRPEDMVRLTDPVWDGGLWPDNVWAGTTAEDQERADERIPHLVKVPARVRFLSCEPLLSRVEISWGLENGIGWVIAGGESGHGARPMHPTWAIDLRAQCISAGTPFLFKQWGDWKPIAPAPGHDLGGDMRADRVRIVKAFGENNGHLEDGDRFMQRVGKKAAGRELGGRTHDGYPS